MAKKHNNANIIAMGGRTTTRDTAKRIVEEWFENEFEGGRHQRRIDKIKDLE